MSILERRVRRLEAGPRAAQEQWWRGWVARCLAQFPPIHPLPGVPADDARQVAAAVSDHAALRERVAANAGRHDRVGEFCRRLLVAADSHKQERGNDD